MVVLVSPLRSLLPLLVAINGLSSGAAAGVVHRRATGTTASMASASSASAACSSAAYQLQGSLLEIKDKGTQSFTLQANCGLTWSVKSASDISSWFVDGTNSPVFAGSSSIAQVASVSNDALIILLHASEIKSFNTNGPGILTIRPPASALTAGQTSYSPVSVVVAEYFIPELVITGEITGSAYTHGKSTLKEMFGIVVEYDTDSPAKLWLDLPGLVDANIDATNATVSVVEGDGYYTSEYTLAANKFTESWVNGKSSYNLQQGDLIINTGDYLFTDPDSNREWSCLGGDGHGNYVFNFEIAGITYNGLPVASQTFRTHIYIYGFNYTSDAIAKYSSSTTATPLEVVIEPLSAKISDAPTPGTTPVFTWVGEGDKPNLADDKTDDVYISWPTGTDASSLEASDVQIILHSAQGDVMALKTGRDYVINTSNSETQISIILQNWPFEPVFSTMSVTVSGNRLAGTIPSADYLTKTYDIGSVYTYIAQQGGGGTTIDGTVTSYSFYGLSNLEDINQISIPANYTLSTTVSGVKMYFAESPSANGTGSLVSNVSSASVYNGSGIDDKNLQLIGNTFYVTTRINGTATKTIDGLPVAFTKAYNGGVTIAPSAAASDLESLPGYILNKTDTTWIFHEKWAWQPSIAVAWGGIYIEPYTGKFEWSLAKGASQQFTSVIPSVSWSLIGALSTGTTISNTGLLTVAEDETASSVAVVAKSTTDKSYQGIGTVNGLPIP